MLTPKKVTEVERLSPNRGSRGGSPITCIVIHDTVSRTASSALNWVTNPTSQVSYHAIVDFDGTIYRCVPDEERAWHGGKSELFGEKDPGGSVNSFSLGIALVDHDGLADVDYTPVQIQALIDWVAGAAIKYRVPLNRIVGHEHIAPGRKFDPGPNFDWYAFLAGVARWIN